MSSNDLCNLLNNHYEDIRPDLAQNVFSAIRAGESAGEFDILPDIYNALHLLIDQLANPEIDDSVALTTYMMNINTRYSATRPFFRFFRRPDFFPDHEVDANPVDRAELAALFVSQPSLPSPLFPFIPFQSRPVLMAGPSESSIGSIALPPLQPVQPLPSFLRPLQPLPSFLQPLPPSLPSRNQY